MTLPSLSSTLRIRTGECSIPALANAPYAEVSDNSVTSPAPSARDGTLGGVPTFNFCAYDNALGMPIVFSICTAARLLDMRNADRIVMDPALECSSSGTHWPAGVSVGVFRLSMTLAGE